MNTLQSDLKLTDELERSLSELEYQRRPWDRLEDRIGQLMVMAIVLIGALFALAMAG